MGKRAAAAAWPALMPSGNHKRPRPGLRLTPGRQDGPLVMTGGGGARLALPAPRGGGGTTVVTQMPDI